jgi:LCP family protein required for cell wall assembly
MFGVRLLKRKFFRTFFISLIFFGVLYSAIGYYSNAKRDEKVNAENNFFDVFANDDENDSDEIVFLLLGIDTKDLSRNDKQRSDTIMLCKMDKLTGDVSILSIPRDTRTNIRGRKSQEKINHAHAYGGPELSVETVRNLLGIDFEYYVRVDYKLVEEYVNLIGGVKLNVPIDMVYDDPVADPPLHINLKKGEQVLNGDKSLQLLRFRKGYKDQDIGRIKTQQYFIKCCIEQTLKPKNIVKLPQFVSAYYKYVDTNIPMDTIMKFAMKAKNINTENIQMATVPGEPQSIGGVSYYIPNEAECDELVKRMFMEHKTVQNTSIIID